MVRNLLFITMFLAVTNLAFQNCGEVSFKKSEAPYSQLNFVGDEALEETTPPIPSCPIGQTFANGQCIETIFTECNSFVELNTNQIPPLVSTGVCYYKKLIDATPSAASGSRGELRAPDVISRTHGAGPTNSNPFVLGDSTLELTFLGNRNISFTSSAVGDVDEIAEAKLKIDNYILYEISDAIEPKRMMARGTADAEPLFNSLVSRIRVDDQPVEDFLAFAPGGTAQVPVVTFPEGHINLNVPSLLRVRMLDCGGAAESSNMYIIIH